MSENQARRAWLEEYPKTLEDFLKARNLKLAEQKGELLGLLDMARSAMRALQLEFRDKDLSEDVWYGLLDQIDGVVLGIRAADEAEALGVKASVAELKGVTEPPQKP